MYLHKGFRLGGAVSKVMPIVHVLSKLGLLFSLLLAVPTLMSYFYHDSAFFVFAYTALTVLLVSCVTWVLTLRFNRELRPRDGFTLVLMLWLAFAVVAAMPIYFYMPSMSFTDDRCDRDFRLGYAGSVGELLAAHAQLAWRYGYYRTGCGNFANVGRGGHAAFQSGNSGYG